MKSSLIWDCTGEKPPIGAVLRNKAPYIRHLEEQAGLNAGLRQLGIERPELVFLAADVLRSDYSALVRTIKLRSPDSFLITLEAVDSSGASRRARSAGADLTLPSLFTEKELLDGIFLAELKQTSPAPAELDGRELAIPSPAEFLQELQQSLHKLPEQVWERHWKLLEQHLDIDANAVGWHLVGLTTVIEDQFRSQDGPPPAVDQARGECLRALAGGPPGPLWHAAYEKLCSAYVSHLQSGGDAASQQIVRIRQYIDEHIEEELSLKRVAQAFYLSTSYLSRLFKNKAGMNFSEYISMRKIERAKALLTETDLSVAEISRQLNYPEQNSFSRFFKSKVGIPPQTYRSLNTRGALDRRSTGPEPVLEDFEITDFGPCAFTSEDLSFAYSFHRRQ